MEHTRIIQDTLRELGAGRKRATQRRTVELPFSWRWRTKTVCCDVTKDIYCAVPKSSAANGLRWSAAIRLVVNRIWS
ncbi:MAG: hypothetical protein ACLU9S_17450 [Oscillospiraceae bacterium]